MRHAIVTFVDIKSAAAVINTENKINDSLLKMEYCSSADTTIGIINHKNINSHRNNTEITNQLPTFNNNNNNNSNHNNSDRKTEKWVHRILIVVMFLLVVVIRLYIV